MKNLPLWLADYARERGWRVLGVEDRAPRAWGAGEVDLLVWDARWPGLWVIEIKVHRLATLGARPLVTTTQLVRLRRACAYYRAQYRGCRVALALLWRDPESGRLEFLENP